MELFYLALIQFIIICFIEIVYFPEFYCGGIVKNKYYAIVTRHIEGSEPSWNSQLDAKLCKRLLAKINCAGIIHEDARTANFIMVEEKLTDDSENVVALQKTPYILDFAFSKLSYNECDFDEDLKEDEIETKTSIN